MPDTPPTIREVTNQIGAALASLRAIDELSLIVAFGAHAPSPDATGGSISVTIQRGAHRATSEAVHLQDAIFLARAKVNAMATAAAKKGAAA